MRHPAPYPVSLIVAGRRCLVVGGGRVAARKVAGLVASGARVTVVAPEVLATIDDLGAEVHRRPYRRGEAGNYRLVVTATGDPAVDGTVADDAEAAGIWVNSADDVAHCSFLLPSVHRDGRVTVAVSTGGASPALATWLRHRIAATLGDGLAPLADLLDEVRRRLQATGRPTESVDWQRLLDGPLPAVVRDGHLDTAYRLLAEATGEPPPTGLSPPTGEP